MYESDYQRERKILPPIGIPDHCALFLPVKDGKMNKTTHEMSPIHCPSFCGIVAAADPAQVNHVPESADVEMPENIEAIETSTASNASRTLHAIEAKAVEAIDTPKRPDSLEPNAVPNSNATRVVAAESGVSVNAQEPRRKPSAEAQLDKPIDLASEPVHSTTPEFVQLSHEHEPNSVYDDQNAMTNKTRDVADASGRGKQTEQLGAAEPVADSHADQTKFMENDIKTSFHTKYDRVEDEAEAERAANIELMKTPNENVNTVLPSPQPLAMPSSPPTLVMPPCFRIDLRVESDSFNTTLGTDEICHNFNITYNIPISKYMEEKRIHLVFV